MSFLRLGAIKMINPIQRLQLCSRPGSQQLNTLLAASGSSIYAFDSSEGSLLQKWSNPQDIEKASRSRQENESAANEDNDGAGRPEKRRKLSPIVHEIREQESLGTGTKNVPKKRGRASGPPYNVASIINLISTSNGSHFVAVTGDDKCVRVFDLNEDGTFNTLSQRTMPKRPSALTMTHDQKTILCGDKFGDVYGLPLIEDPNWEPTKHSEDNAGVEGSEPTAKHHVPAANEFTVHSKKNRATLEYQRKQKSAKKDEQKPPFEHQLLLGHVSLLTDVAAIRIQVDGHYRNYILSADRDEHIRVSRGIPQTHIIENYCLGHDQFISKMCSPAWRPKMLISGGGDDYLISWDWITGAIKQEIDLRTPVEAVRTTLRSGMKLEESLAESVIAVTGIWALQTQNLEGQIVVICEGLPALLTYQITQDGGLRHQETLITSHNVLDVAVDQEKKQIIYSLDNVHRPSSTSELEPERSGPFFGVQSFSLDTGRWIDECSGDLCNNLNRWARSYQSSSLEIDASQLSSLFYTTGNLRKWGGEEDDAAAAE